jgi:hypothetical protein
MYIEIKSDDPQPIVDLLARLVNAGDRAQVSLGKCDEFMLVQASINETEDVSIPASSAARDQGPQASPYPLQQAKPCCGP